MFEFEWDPAKAANNLRKHKIGFELAATVFEDSFGASFPDREQGVFEERWITMGQALDGRLLVVSHTGIPAGGHRAVVRIISARTATRHERRQYEERDG